MKEYRYRKEIEKHESSNQDCLLILEQSERISELESSLQRFIDQAQEVKIRRELTSLETVHLEECKQILEKGK